MGACSSCLGLRRRDEDIEDGETSRLLSDDPYRSQYGAHAQNAQRHAYQPDPESVKREREALDSICHAMSDNMIDVFTVQPQASGSVTPRPQSSADSSAESPKSSQRPKVNGNGSLSPEEVKMRTIKKGRGGPVFSTLGRGADGWKAVQEAIG